MMKSNCIFFALALYQRRKQKGREAYLVIRHTRLGLGPHLLYAERRRSGLLRVVSYTPKDQTPKKCPPVVFDGRTKWGDK